MNKLLLQNAKIITEKTMIQNGYLLIENDKITDFGKCTKMPEITDARVLTLSEDQTILPGFIDQHIHGVCGADTMDATANALRTMAKSLPAEGTTSFLATTITQSDQQIVKALQNGKQYMLEENKTGQAEMLGIHLEGPFIHEHTAGAQPEKFIIKPQLSLFKKWQKLSGDNIKIVTLAPDKEGANTLIRYLAEQQIVASIGHTEAAYEKVQQAIEDGALQCTHLFNAMKGIHHREPGTAGAVLTADKLSAELIADGIHVHPAIVKLAIKAKGIERVILITDSMRAKSLAEGEYDLGGQQVHVKNGKALLANGTLAGSILKMDQAIRNVREFAGVSLQEAAQLASLNPAKQLRVDDRKGSIAIGKDADLVVLDNQLHVSLTICRGKIAYGRGGDFT
ncbi:N-acetylglucosamine-6-phosphate deacetylase [Bacillaceae bacterium Marseille-Q3522]|nr:N-acetylglucosamine-6-phosphate deacetylase [Bacillaceae bacterium Marseille-Q3522]